MTTADAMAGYGMWFGGIPAVKADGWAAPPQSLGDVIADELVTICAGREMEPIRLTMDEKKRLMMAIELWGGPNRAVDLRASDG